MAIKPTETLKISKKEQQRVDALETYIDAKINKRFDPKNPEDVVVPMSGSEWFLKGKSLSKPELAEIKRRYKEAGWNIKASHDRTCQSLRFSSSVFPTLKPNW